MTDPKTILTRVNDVFAEAIVEYLTAQNGPVDNADLSNAILGGSIQSEIEMVAPEPYWTALLRLAKAGTIVCYADQGTGGHIRTELATRATAENFAAAQEALAESGVDTIDPNDPSTFRHESHQMIADHAAAQQERQEMIAQLVAASFAGGDDEVVH
jgi:hypothetical protein